MVEMKNFDFNFRETLFFTFLSVIAHIMHHYAPNKILQKLFLCHHGKIKKGRFYLESDGRMPGK